MGVSESREERILREACKWPSADRAAFLHGACGDDDALRRRVEARLAAQGHVEPAASTASGAPGPTTKLDGVGAPDEAVGQMLGRYKVLQKIGEGGCGAVYMAEQEHPVRRKVALKVIKLGLDTKAVIARFEAERQALALMDHPNIAKVLDAGATAAGRPYFVMELVRGIKFTEYCDQNQLGLRQRLELFIQICHAIQHAHQKGIIHRDIKPSNILVTLHDGVPVPKVIDFGIAKATTDQRLTDKTLFTAYEQFIGTPAYMSPEQAEMSGLDIDTRSDIYSLGVLLYELLTGSTPFDTKELLRSSLDEMRKIIRERPPSRPSTRLTQQPGPQIANRKSPIANDLDWIVMKCLEKDRTRRYETANGLAMDLKRHLSNEPVLARPPSKLYEFQKTVRRHRIGFAATAAVIFVLAAGVALTTWQAARATRAKQEAVAAQGREGVQRQKAEANERRALEAKASEAKLRQQAEAAELAARQRAYASDMNVAKQALDGNNLGRALELLNRQWPQPGQQDLRGWEWRYLWQQTRSDALFTLGQINGASDCLTASPEGRWLAVGSYHKGGLALWDLQTRKQVVRLAENEQYFRATFSPTEPLLAFTSVGVSRSGEGDFKATLHLWDWSTRQMVGEFPLDKECAGVAFSQDGRTLVTSTVSGHITLWAVTNGTRLASFPSEQASRSGGTQFSVARDASRAAYTLRHGRIRVIDLRNGSELWNAQASTEDVLSLAFSPDGKSLASGDGYSASAIHLWDAATGKEIQRLEGHKSWIGALVFWPDGGKLASASADETIRIWDLASGKCLDVLRGHDKEVWRLALLPDDRTLVSCAKDGTICLWDASVRHARTARITIPQRVLGWCLSPDGRSLLTLDPQGQLTRWTGADFQEHIPVLCVVTNLDAASLPYSLFSGDGRFLAAGSPNGILEVWDISRRALWRRLTNTVDAVLPQAFLAEGKKLVTWQRRQNLLQEWDLAPGCVIASWKAPAVFSCCRYSPDERLWVGIGYEGAVIVRNLTDGSSLSRDSIFEASDAAFSPDGKLIAVASELGFGRVWEAAAWKSVIKLGGFLLGTHSVAFSPDGKRLAVGGDGKEALKLWDTGSWQEVLTLEGDSSVFHRTMFSADGNVVGSCNSSGTLHLWRAASWEEIAAAEANKKEEARQP